MINKLFTLTALSCFMVANCYGDESSVKGCRDCERDQGAHILVTDSSKSNQKKCPCEGNNSLKGEMVSSSGSSVSAPSISSESVSSASEFASSSGSSVSAPSISSESVSSTSEVV